MQDHQHPELEEQAVTLSREASEALDGLAAALAGHGAPPGTEALIRGLRCLAEEASKPDGAGDGWWRGTRVSMPDGGSSLTLASERGASLAVQSDAHGRPFLALLLRGEEGAALRVSRAAGSPRLVVSRGEETREHDLGGADDLAWTDEPVLPPAPGPSLLPALQALAEGLLAAGEALTGPREGPPVPKASFCVNCGQRLPAADSRFCPRCGQAVDGVEGRGPT